MDSDEGRSGRLQQRRYICSRARGALRGPACGARATRRRAATCARVCPRNLLRSTKPRRPAAPAQVVVRGTARADRIGSAAGGTPARIQELFTAAGFESVPAVADLLGKERKVG